MTKRKINSRQKGAAGEREWRDFLKERGFEARRTQQYAGFTGDASDIVCEALKQFHWEVKRVELLNISKAMAQATRDTTNTNRTPIVAHRRSREEWFCTMKATDLLAIFQELYHHQKEKSDEPE